MEKVILCLLIFLLCLALASTLSAERTIKKTKNALFHVRSGNGPYRRLLYIGKGKPGSQRVKQWIKIEEVTRHRSIFGMLNKYRVLFVGVKTRFHYKDRKEHSLFLLLIFLRIKLRIK